MNKEKTSIVFTGDIGFDHYIDQKWNDPDLISEDILDFLHSADHVVANIEGPICKQEKQPLSNSVLDLMHVIDPEAMQVFRKMNTKIWNLNNNHIMDAGEEGLRNTLKAAESFGAKTLGVGMNIEQASAPLILDSAGGIGLISVGYQRGCKPASIDKAGCLSWSELEIIQRRIKEIKKKCRWCIIVSHGGEEFTALPHPYTRNRYLEYLNMGADIIICHHPHVPMNYETFPGKIIFYSLGNFIFDTNYQRAQYNTEKGLLIKIVFSENDFNFTPMGIVLDRKKEHIEKGDLPAIFQDIQIDEYNKLLPLSAKMFIAATKRQQIFLNPDKFKNATPEQWHEHFMEPKRSGRVPGEALDFHIICPIAEQEVNHDWKQSKLTDVVDYILAQM